MEMRNKLILFASFSAFAFNATARKPNVIIILADDLGYGDVSAQGSKTIQTPCIDRLANEGIRFTHGYATSATSTPSRYALLTGMYPWKNKDGKILEGNAPLIIRENQPTLPKIMKQAGYSTGAIGKWHLGMGNGNPDWNKTIKPGANEIGFDYSCLIAATNDRVPTVYVENGNVINRDPSDPIYVNYTDNFEGEPTALTNPELLKMMWSHGHNNSIVNGVSRIGFQKGGKRALWNDENMADYFLGKALSFIADNKNKPFFLYYGLHEPHVPRIPNSKFVGKSGMGPRGDAILEADWCVGELYNYLERNNLLENTLIIFSSDNGPVLDDGYADQAKELLGNHKPAGPFRGGKYSLFEAGTRIPFFWYWKGVIVPKVSAAMVCQLDIMASLAKLSGVKLPENLDSKNYLSVFMGKNSNARKELVIEAGTRVAYRNENYVMIPPYSGSTVNAAGIEVGNMKEFGLFILRNDSNQQINLAKQYPQMVEKMNSRLKALTKDKAL